MTAYAFSKLTLIEDSEIHLTNLVELTQEVNLF